MANSNIGRQRYVVVDARGRLTGMDGSGFYVEGGQVPVPANAIPISDQIWRDWLAKGIDAYHFNGEEIVPFTVPEEEAAAKLASLRSRQAISLLRQADTLSVRAMRELLLGDPQNNVEAFRRLGELEKIAVELRSRIISKGPGK